MRTESEAAQLREELDKSLRWLRRHRIQRPFKGWICQIREALGMTISELGHRMKVTASTVSSLQESERHGTIEIKTLKRVAGALDCHLFYALVPNRPLAQIVAGRRRLIASAQMAHACKGLSQPERLSMLPDWAKMIKRNRVWKDVPRMDVTKLIEEVRGASEKPGAVAETPTEKGSEAQAAKPTREELEAARKRLDELDNIPIDSRTRDEIMEWARLVVFIDANKEPQTPEEEARWKRLDELDRKGVLGRTREEEAEYEELLGPDDDEDEDEDEKENEDEAKEEADNENGDKADDAKDDEDNDEDARKSSDENDEEPTAPLTLAKVALVLSAGLKGAEKPETKASDAAKPKPDVGGPRIRGL